ncbi:MAG: sugar transferase [Chloroflexi bacterium]|nr:sugar transferase [Chloroflexota bacterium]
MRRVQLGLKRLFDILVSLSVVTLGLPLFVILAVLVKLSSPGPVFFVQERAGKGGKPFRICKFRSMTVAPPGHQVTRWNAAEEARIMPIGGFLRDYGLDELPQVLNILKGDMSIIGPRPRLPAQVKDYDERQRQVFQMRPGVTCLGAFQGRRSLPLEARIELQVQYVETWSLWLDLIILARTIPVVLRRKDARDILPS